MKVELPDTAATEALGLALAAALPADLRGWMLLLSGELGSGKTTLARALLCGLGHVGPVPSPTYTLVEPYELPRGQVFHIDLYRIGDADELQYLGWDELEDGLRLVEWPERAPHLQEQADLRLELTYRGAGRAAGLLPLSARGRELLALRLPAALAGRDPAAGAPRLAEP